MESTQIPVEGDSSNVLIRNMLLRIIRNSFNKSFRRETTMVRTLKLKRRKLLSMTPALILRATLRVQKLRIRARLK